MNKLALSFLATLAVLGFIWVLVKLVLLYPSIAEPVAMGAALIVLCLIVWMAIHELLYGDP